jgi:hypothetical protein
MVHIKELGRELLDRREGVPCWGSLGWWDGGKKDVRIRARIGDIVNRFSFVFCGGYGTQVPVSTRI